MFGISSSLKFNIKFGRMWNDWFSPRSAFSGIKHENVVCVQNSRFAPMQTSHPQPDQSERDTSGTVFDEGLRVHGFREFVTHQNRNPLLRLFLPCLPAGVHQCHFPTTHASMGVSSFHSQACVLVRGWTCCCIHSRNGRLCW